MIKKINLPFSEFLKGMISGYYHNVNILSQKTAQLGKELNTRLINKYLHSDIVPPLENALILIEALDLDVPLKELRKSIELEKKKQTEAKHTFDVIEKHIKIPRKEFDKELKTKNGNISRIIDKRVKELYPDSKRAFSLYVKDLIIKDIKENLINEK